MAYFITVRVVMYVCKCIWKLVCRLFFEKIVQLVVQEEDVILVVVVVRCSSSCFS